MESTSRLLERDRIWDAARRVEGDLLREGFSELGARAQGMFQEKGVRNILVLGCGRENDAMLFSKRGFCVLTVDLSSVGLGRAEGMTESRAPVRCGALLAQNIRDRIPEPSSSVDAIYSVLFLCMDLQEEEIKDVMRECLDVLRPGGLMVLSVHSDRDPDCGKATKCGVDEWKVDRGFVVHFFSEDRIKKVARGFEILWVREYKEAEPLSRVMYEVVLMRPKGL